MYELKVPSSFQGIMRMPMQPVMSPPVRNEMRRGLRFEKSLDGETTLAATLVLSVAISRATSATSATAGWLNRPIKATGSQPASPKITNEADATATPVNEHGAVARGS